MKNTINILAIGDIVGRPGRTIVRNKILGIKEQNRIDLIIANGENAAGGLSITPETTREILNCGVDIITTGNHIWHNKDIIDILDSEKRLIRPANYPDGVRGHGYYLHRIKGLDICVINLLGRINLATIDCPFRKFDAIYNEVKDTARIIIVDFHAEATSEKKAFGWYVNGRASAVFGTHTHVQTADETILSGGTGYITDIGMTGPFDSVIGMEKEISINGFLYHTKPKFKVATKDVKCNGIILKINKSGKTEEIKRITIEE